MTTVLANRFGPAIGPGIGPAIGPGIGPGIGPEVQNFQLFLILFEFFDLIVFGSLESDKDPPG